MKNVNIESIRIPAYAVVNTNTNFAVSIALNRDDARSDLQAMKQATGSKDFKIVKLTASHFVR